jgi:AmiR/NasT family two-component response regulator
MATAPLNTDQSLAELLQPLRDENDQLRRALASRIVIEQAKGVLSERYGLPLEDAFEVLRRAARANRMRIHFLAARVAGARTSPREIVEALLVDQPKPARAAERHP